MADGSVCAVVPAWNEQANIRAVINDLRLHQSEIDIVVVDDFSSDETAATARTANVTVLELPVNLGIGGAVQTGFMYARDHGYEIAIQFDGDGQHRAVEIDTILGPIRQDRADVVIGSRFTGGSRYSVGFFRWAGITLLRWLSRLLTGYRVTDNTSGFRAFNRQAIEFLARFYSQDYPEPQAVIELYRNRFRIEEVPVEMVPRRHGKSSIRKLKSGYYMFKVIMANIVAFTRRPEQRTGG
ncbi:MAG: glycosyltransferase family 2 protein [Candidatus Zixiibacteriota bacterium]|nr:MAG: glycosyltransferase family 2 protein [candidate division Zixibacteria bacterium]